MGSCKHWIQYTFSMFVLFILFFFVLCIVSNAYSCPFLVVPSVFYVCVVYFVCLRSAYCIQCLQLPIPGCPVDQEWAAVNIGYNTQNEDEQNTQHKHRKPTGQPGMGSCKHWIQYTERRPMFTAAHSWLSRRFSMFVLCILFFFVLCIVSNVYSCPFLVVPSVFYVCVVHFVCLRSVFVSNVYSCHKINNTNIENRRDNQEWAAVNIGYNTQNEDEQNT
jgi:hypothetical protein